MSFFNLFRGTPSRPIIFSTDDPIFQSGDRKEPISLLRSGGYQGLEKLLFWLTQHESAFEFLIFYTFSPHKTSSIEQFRAVALRSQILSGLEIIARQELFANVPRNLPFAKSVFPFPSLGEVQEALQIWKEICVNDLCCLELKREIEALTAQSYRELKDICGSILSLFAAQDVMPPNYIPIILFNRLDLNVELVVNRNPRCRLLRERVDVQLNIGSALMTEWMYRPVIKKQCIVCFSNFSRCTIALFIV
jgi:hypothetical protein